MVPASAWLVAALSVITVGAAAVPPVTTSVALADVVMSNPFRSRVTPAASSALAASVTSSVRVITPLLAVGSVELSARADTVPSDTTIITANSAVRTRFFMFSPPDMIYILLI